MAIEIIDGFKVNSAVPVDNRIVASGSTARDAITYKYEGLRVFDTYDSIPYVWLNNIWEKENKTALSVPSTVTPGFSNTSSYRAGQVLKVYNDNKLLTNSNMFEVEFLNSLGNITSKTVAINHSTPTSVSSGSILDVNGSIKATTFQGSGANITNIDPVNFNTSINKIQTNQISNGTSGYILQTVDDGLGNLSVQWKNPSSAISPSSVNTRIETNDININYLTFVPNTGIANMLVSTGSTQSTLGYIPQSGQILVKGANSPLTPPYSFLGETNTGIYRSGAGIVAISILGNIKAQIDINGLKVNAGSATTPGISFIGGNNYGIYQTTSGSNRLGVVVAGNEMIRIKSSSTQGNGNTTFYGDGNVLSIQGNTHAYIEFYRNGSSSLTASSTRSAYIGYPSNGVTNFIIKNEVYGTYVDLASSGSINIYANRGGDFATMIENSSGRGLAVKNIGINGGESIRLIGRTGSNFISLHDGLTLDISNNPIRTFWMGHGSTSLGNNAITFSHELSSGYMKFMVGGYDKIVIGSAGLKIGTDATYIKKVIIGTVMAYINGSACVIKYGSGFSATMTGSGAAAMVRITFNTPFSTGNLSTQVSVGSGTPGYPYGGNSTYIDIKLDGLGSGTVYVHFMIMEV